MLEASTNQMRISMIAAIAAGNRALGKDNKLIYHIHEDLERFKKLTSGHPIIMGRKTFESIGHPLPNRTNIVVTRNRQKAISGATVVSSLEEAIERAKESPGSDEVFIIGGGQIYGQAIGMADKLYLTVVEGNPDADTFFPDYSAFTKVVNKEEHESDGHKYTFLDLER